MIQKLFKKETAVESAGISLAFRLLEKVVQFFRGVVIARWLGPNEYGVLSLAFFFISLIVAISKFGIPSCYARYIPQYEKKNMLADFLRKNVFITLIGAAICTAISMLFSHRISELVYSSDAYQHIIILCALFIIPHVLYDNLLSSFKGMRVLKMAASLSFIYILVFSILAVIFVLLYPKAQSSLTANLISMVLITVLFGSFLLKYIMKSDSQKVKIEEDGYYRKIFKYSVWFIVTPIVYIVFDYIDRLMVNRFLGLHDVGIYSVAMNISTLLFMFGTIAGNALMPNLSKLWEDGKKEKAMDIINFSIKIVTFFTLGCAAVLVIFKEQVVLIIYGSQYLEALQIIPILIVFWIFHVIVWLGISFPQLIEKTHLNFIAMIPAILFNIGLNYLLIPKYGIIGAASATTISYAILLSTLMFLNKQAKMVIHVSTIVACVSPIVLLFNNVIIIIVMLLLSAMFLKTNLLINQDEKELLTREFGNVRRKFTRSS